MKFPPLVLTLACGGILAAQDKTTVPLGSITVNASSGNEVMVQSTSSSSRGRDRGSAPAGMKRLGGGNSDLDVHMTNGPVMLKSVSGSVVAHSLNGSVTVMLDEVMADKPVLETSSCRP